MLEHSYQGQNKSKYIKDARGNRVRRFDPVYNNLLHRYDMISQEQLKVLIKNMDYEIRDWKILFYSQIIIFGSLFGFIIVLLSCLAISRGTFWQSLKVSPRDLLGIGFWIALTFLFFYSIIRQARHDVIKNVMLKNKRCPHCAYDIQGLPVNESDNATICPECGSAWILGPE